MRRKVYTWEIENEKYHEHGGKGEFHDQRDQDCHLRQDGDDPAGVSGAAGAALRRLYFAA